MRVRYKLEKRLRSVPIEPKSDHCLASGTNMVNLVKAVKGRQKFFLYQHQKILVSSHSHECTKVNSTLLGLLVHFDAPERLVAPDVLLMLNVRCSGLTLNNDLVNSRHQARGDLCCLVVSDVLLMYY